jgi:hypothetical protein
VSLLNSPAKDAEIRMGITYVVDHARRRVLARAEGLLTFPDIAAHIDAEIRDRPPSYQELFDATGATTDLTAEQVQTMVQHTYQALQKEPVGEVAIVATEPATFGLSRMYSILCEQTGPRVEVFRSVADAEHWLDSRRGVGGHC